VGLDPRAHQFVADDAFSWLKRALKKPERYDLAILDPPSYSSTKRGRFVAETGYAELAAETMRVLGPGAELLACTNHRGIRTAKFRRVLFDAARLAEREVVQVKDLPPPSDYPAPVGAESHLKAVWVKLR
jgi:23S rRNA (cytosine1962-C5)-methyltransferase